MKERSKPSPELLKAVQENAKRIGMSATFFCMFNEGMCEEVIPLVQMGLAVYMDKPIYIICPQSIAVTIPGNLRRMAVAIEMYADGDEASLFAATQRLITKAKQRGDIR